MPDLRSLPLFPLDLVLYPGARQPLHIFEERYQALAAHCLEADAPFGIVLTREDDALASVGTTAEIEDVARRYDDGRLDLVSVGGERFRTAEVRSEEQPYLTARVEAWPDTDEADAPRATRERVITQHMKLLELAGHTPRPSLYDSAPPKRLAFVLAQNAALRTPQKQEVLELRSEEERMAFLAEHLEALLPRVEKQQSMRERIRSNGHFRDFPQEG